MIDFAVVAELTIPANQLMEAGSPFKKTWLLRNTGNEIWEGCRLTYCRGTIIPAFDSQPLPAARAGELAELSVEGIAPASIGSHEGCWQFQDAAGQPVGPELTAVIQTTPAGLPSGYLIAYQTNEKDGGGPVEAARPFTQSLVLANSGGRPWRSDDHLHFLGGDAQPEQPAMPLPAIVPGDQAILTFEMAAGRQFGPGATYWQFRSASGSAFGGIVAPEFEVIPLKEPSFSDDGAVDPQKWRQVIWSITGVFESGRVGGDPAALQTFDAGIVSFGKHQATLQSGNLAAVLEKYTAHSTSTAGQTLQSRYLHRVQQRDPALRDDAEFHALLRQAAADPAMAAAQDDVFAAHFFNPSVTRAGELGLKTPLGLACLYDTRIQHGSGGADFIIELTSRNFQPPPAESGAAEADWLAAFLNEREALLNRLADKRELEATQTSDGQRQNTLRLTARALRTSTFRVRELRALLISQNFGLTGKFSVRGLVVEGL